MRRIHVEENPDVEIRGKVLFGADQGADYCSWFSETIRRRGGQSSKLQALGARVILSISARRVWLVIAFSEFSDHSSGPQVI